MCRGVILSCTNLRTITVIEQIETACGLPVLSSNQALAWHMRELAGVRKAGAVPGAVGSALTKKGRPVGQPFAISMISSSDDDDLGPPKKPDHKDASHAH